MYRHFCAAVCVLLSVPMAIAAAANPRPMSAVDMIELTRLSDPALSPDGRYVVYLRSSVDWDINEFVDRYRLIDTLTGESLPVPAPEEDDESFREAIWSPASDCFVTRLNRDADDFRQIYRYCLDDGEFSAVTDHGSSISSVIWSSDPELIYFVAPRQRSEEDERLIDDDWVIEAYDAERVREIWELNLTTSETRPIVAGDFSVRSAELSRDGTQLTYVRAPDQEPDSIHDADVWTWDIESGVSARLTTNAHREVDPRLSPDGSSLAYIATVSEDFEPYYEDKVFVHRRDADEPERLLAEMPMEALDFAWDATGDGLFILGNTGLRTSLFHYELESRQLTDLTPGDHVLDDWSYSPATGQHLARVVSSADPGNVAIAADPAAGFDTVFDEYAEWRASFELPVQEAFSWRGRDRTALEGLLVYPLGYEPGTRYPLVTIVHGGPRSSSQFGSWNRSRHVAVLAGSGYAVFLPNHRGGTGYGDRFMRDMVGNYFRNSDRDVLSGIDALIDAGIADPDRLIAMGWSAGGHMVNRLITVTDRFAAASSGAGASEWVSMHGESDVRHNRRFWFGGNYPWSRNFSYRPYRQASPLHNAWRVTTPTLFFVGEDDIRVPPTQSILMHRGVRAAGAETELYVADGQEHQFDKPSYALFKTNRELAWYAEHALGEVYTPVLPEAATRPRDDEADAADDCPEDCVDD